MMLSKVLHCISNLDDIEFEIAAFHQDFGQPIWGATRKTSPFVMVLHTGSPSDATDDCDFGSLMQFAQTITFFQHAMLAKLRCLPKEAARLQMNASLAGSGAPVSIDRAARISSKCIQMPKWAPRIYGSCLHVVRSCCRSFWPTGDLE